MLRLDFALPGCRGSSPGGACCDRMAAAVDDRALPFGILLLLDDFTSDVSDHRTEPGDVGCCVVNPHEGATVDPNVDGGFGSGVVQIDTGQEI